MKKYISLKVITFLFIIFSSNIFGKTVCLNMIVKDEKHCIKRALASVKPIIDKWVIVDTGSTDGTQAVIQEFLSDIPGKLYEREWKNFADNRMEALNLAKDEADYILFIDADDELVFSKDFKMPDLDRDFYYIVLADRGVKYKRIQLINAKLNWEWKGVIHNYITLSPGSKNFSTLKNVEIKRNYDGARSKDPEKFQKNAEILEGELKKDPNNKRYRFYLAESLRDAGKYGLAIENYEKRIKMGGWEEEIFWSMLQIAKLKERLKIPERDFLKDYYMAYLFRPSRIEPLYYIANRCRKNKNYLLGYLAAKEGIEKRSYRDILFVEDWIYRYGLLLEFSLCAYWLKRYEESKAASLEILKTEDVPKHVEICAEKNLHYACSKLEKLKRDKIVSIKPIKLRKRPWLTEEAVAFLEEFLKKNENAKVLEFGSGSSTLWIANRTDNLTSIEHDPNWFREVFSKLDDKRISYILYPTPYYEICDVFENGYFDLIIVDGRNRKGCISRSLRLLKRGGVLMLDNSEREYYHGVFPLMKDWKSVITEQKKADCEGYWYKGWQTRWWYKP